MSDNESNPEGYRMPLHTSLTQPVLFFGVPRTMGIIGLTFTLAVCLGLKMWLVGLPISVIIHAAAVWLTKNDPCWFDILRSHLKQPTDLNA